MSGRRALHNAVIKHDPESHKYDCHDDCSADIECSGVTDACRCWRECNTCRDATKDMDEEAALAYRDDLYEEGEKHGVEHQHIDGMWMTPTQRCISLNLENDAYELVDSLADGSHPVDLDCEEGFVYILPIKQPAEVPS